LVDLPNPRTRCYPPSMPGIPLTACADRILARLAQATGAPAIAALDGATLLGERAMLADLAIPGTTSAGGGCRLLPATDGLVALNLARDEDRDLLPALFEDGALDPRNDAAIAAQIARADAAALVARGRMMGLAIAATDEPEHAPAAPVTLLTAGRPVGPRTRATPCVLDLSALWAGPLAGHLLWLAGAEVIKVESRTRPDAMRDDPSGFFGLINQGKASVALDLADRADRAALLALIAASDIVIEAARPRALRQLGIDADAIAAATPGLVWLTITAHGATGEPAGWVGFGDDVGVAAGLSRALHAATGRSGFVGDAIADPLTGLHAALTGWDAWQSGHGGRYGVAMRDVTAHCVAEEQARDAAGFDAALRAWARAAGSPFPMVARRAIGAVAALGGDTKATIERLIC
jgi:hypothetical protein